jgi:CRP-like cAMP-binding protein
LLSVQDLQRKTLEYYAFLWERSLNQDRLSLFPNLPSTLALQHEIELKKVLIDSCDLFNGANITRRCVVAVIRRLTPTIAIPEEVLFSQREKGDRMHFLSSGICTKFHMTDGDGSFAFEQLGQLHDGDYFGEVAFFEANNMHTYSAKTDSHCHLETLLYTELATLMKLHIEIAEQVQASARVQARLMRNFMNGDQDTFTLNFEDKYDRISRERERMRHTNEVQQYREQKNRENKQKAQSPLMSPFTRNRLLKQGGSGGKGGKKGNKLSGITRGSSFTVRNRTPPGQLRRQIATSPEALAADMAAEALEEKAAAKMAGSAPVMQKRESQSQRANSGEIAAEMATAGSAGSAGDEVQHKRNKPADVDTSAMSRTTKIIPYDRDKPPPK